MYEKKREEKRNMLTSSPRSTSILLCIYYLRRVRNTKTEKLNSAQSVSSSSHNNNNNNNRPSFVRHICLSRAFCIPINMMSNGTPGWMVGWLVGWMAGWLVGQRAQHSFHTRRSEQRSRASLAHWPGSPTDMQTKGPLSVRSAAGHIFIAKMCKTAKVSEL